MQADSFAANGHPSLDALISLDAPVPAPERPAPAKRGRGGRPAIIDAPAEPTLADATDILATRLARSLNLPTDAGTPEPSAFIAALEKVHAALVQSRADLGAWADDLDKREMALERDRKAVEALRAEAAASLRLARLTPPTARSTQRRGVLARLMWWRRG